jgi:hypothetical protein
LEEPKPNTNTRVPRIEPTKRDFGEAVTTYIIVLASMSQIFDNFFLLMGLFVGVFGEHTDRRLGYNMVRRVSPHSVINCRVGKTKTKKPNTKTIVAYTCTTLADRTKSEPDAPPTAQFSAHAAPRARLLKLGSHLQRGDRQDSRLG